MSIPFLSRERLWLRSTLKAPVVELCLLCSLFLAGTAPLTADTLSSNLTNTSSGTESATGSTWLTASFGTGSSAATLDTISLLLASSSVGMAEVDLYSDGLLAPGSLVAQLTAPPTYSSTLANTNFTATGVTLSADTTYWIVLKALSGAFNWSWTNDNAGTGTGYQGVWGASTDNGSTWFTYTVYPTQFSVTTSASAATSTPEPNTWLLSGVGLLIAGAALGKRLDGRNRKGETR
jgi:hypothetical protein